MDALGDCFRHEESVFDSEGDVGWGAEGLCADLCCWATVARCGPEDLCVGARSVEYMWSSVGPLCEGLASACCSVAGASSVVTVPMSSSPVVVGGDLAVGGSSLTFPRTVVPVARVASRVPRDVHCDLGEWSADCSLLVLGTVMCC